MRQARKRTGASGLGLDASTSQRVNAGAGRRLLGLRSENRSCGVELMRIYDRILSEHATSMTGWWMKTRNEPRSIAGRLGPPMKGGVPGAQQGAQGVMPSMGFCRLRLRCDGVRVRSRSPSSSSSREEASLECSACPGTCPGGRTELRGCW